MSKNIFIPDYLQIPNQVFCDRKLSGSDMLIYGVIYWHTKLKGEKCFASNKTIGEIIGVKGNKVSESISRLEKGGYINAIYTDKTKKQRKELIPLVEYQKRMILRTDEPDTPNGVTPDTPNGEQNKNIYNKNIKEDIAEPSSAGVVAIIDIFREWNPLSKDWYRNKTERKACQWLIDEFGLEKSEEMVKALPKINSMPFAPITTSPSELKRNYAKLKAFGDKQRSKLKTREFIM
jgi:hypothetical protein